MACIPTGMCFLVSLFDYSPLVELFHRTGLHTDCIVRADLQCTVYHTVSPEYQTHKCESVSQNARTANLSRKDATLCYL